MWSNGRVECGQLLHEISALAKSRALPEPEQCTRKHKGAAILPSLFVCDSRHGFQNHAAHCKTAYEESADGLLRDDGIRELRSGTRHNR
jgi:hypothetical protein